MPENTRIRMSKLEKNPRGKARKSEALTLKRKEGKIETTKKRRKKRSYDQTELDQTNFRTSEKEKKTAYARLEQNARHTSLGGSPQKKTKAENTTRKEKVLPKS